MIRYYNKQICMCMLRMMTLYDDFALTFAYFMIVCEFGNKGFSSISSFFKFRQSGFFKFSASRASASRGAPHMRDVSEHKHFLRLNSRKHFWGDFPKRGTS